MGNIKEIKLKESKEYPNLFDIITISNLNDFCFTKFEYSIKQKNQISSEEIIFSAFNEKGSGRLLLDISDWGGHASGFARNYDLADYIDMIRKSDSGKITRIHDAGWEFADLKTLDYTVKRIIEKMTGLFLFSFLIQWKNDYRKEFLKVLFKDYEKNTKLEQMITKYLYDGDNVIRIGRNQKYLILSRNEGGLFRYTNEKTEVVNKI